MPKPLILRFDDFSPVVEQVERLMGRGFSDKKGSMVAVSDPRDRSFVATIPEIPGCRAAGRTRDEAMLKLERTFGMIRRTYALKKIPLPRPRRP